MNKRTKRRGHFCWCCGCMRPEECFSGRGHTRHLCKNCSKLGREELAYRQAVRDIDRSLDWNGLVRVDQRKNFERLLSHPEDRVRRYAEEAMANDARTRETYRQQHLAGEAEELDLERSRAREFGAECPHCSGWVPFDSGEASDAHEPTTARSQRAPLSDDEDLPF